MLTYIINYAYKNGEKVRSVTVKPLRRVHDLQNITRALDFINRHLNDCLVLDENQPYTLKTHYD